MYPTSEAVKTGNRIRLLAAPIAPLFKALAALLATVLLPFSSGAVGPTQAWVQRYNGPLGSSDHATKAITDSAGNVIVAGSSDQQVSGRDILVIKYSAAGAMVWINRYDGPGNADDYPQALAVDATGNVYVAGSSVGGNGFADYVTIKYSSAGVPLWTNRYDGPAGLDDRATAVAVDAGGNVYVTGSSVGASGYSDYATIAYSSAGLPLWTNRYDGPAGTDDFANAAAVDVSGNVYVTGYSVGSDGFADYATLKYSSAGVPLWTNRYDGPDTGDNHSNALAVDGSGSVIVTGYSTSAAGDADYATLKYSSAGTPLWTNRYNGPGNSDDFAQSVTVDSGGNAYVTGYSTGSGSGFDYATIKYSGAGVPLWTNWYNGPGNADNYAQAIAVDAGGNVLVTGYSTGSGSGYDYATIKYSTAGLSLWTNRYNGPGNADDEANAVAVDSSGNVLVTGYSSNGADDDFATIKYSSAGAPLWTTRYNGPGNSDGGPLAVTLDTIGNVYVTGYSYNGTNYDYATIKYSSAGLPLWINRYDGPGNDDDRAQAVAVDAAGNVYVTGSSFGATSGSDYATIKYSSAGVPLWTNRYNGPGDGDDQAQAVAVDAGGNVFVTGYSTGSGSGYDYATIAYSSAGVPLWTNRYNGPGNSFDYATGLALDASGNVFVTGYSWGSGSGFDYATVAYSNAGLPLWTNRYNGPANSDDQPKAIAVDAAGNVYVTGFSAASSFYPYNHDYLTLKYSGAGQPLWTNRYNGPGNDDDEAWAIALDAAGNVFVTGYSVGATSGADYATIKYSSAGTPLWTNRYNGPGNGDDEARAIGLDAGGNVYVTGYSASSSLDPVNYDYATIAYSSAGVPLWTNRYNGPANGDDQPLTKSSLAVSPGGVVCVTGASDGSFGALQTFDFATVEYIGAPVIITQPLSRTNVAGTTASFSVAAMGLDPLHYQWLKQGTNLLDGGSLAGVTTTNLIITNVQTADAGDYSVVVSDIYGSVTSSVARLTVQGTAVVSETLHAQLLSASQLRVVVQGSAGRVFALQGSPDVFHWASLGTHTNVSGTLAITNIIPAGHKAYFYRTAVFTPPPPPLPPAPTLSGPRLLSGGKLRFQLNAVAGSAWRVQGSPDLFYWGDYGIVTNATGTLAITNTPFGRPKAYFYRVVQP